MFAHPEKALQNRPGENMGWGDWGGGEGRGKGGGGDEGELVANLSVVYLN